MRPLLPRFNQTYYSHTLTLSHSHTLTLSHSHTLTLSHSHTLTHSHSHTLNLSHSHTLTHSHSHTLTLSHSHTLTLSHSHTLTLYLLSRQTAPTPIVLSQYTLLPLRFPLLTRHLVALYDGYLYFLSCTFKESERLLSFGGPFLNDHQPKPLVG
jgi:hypothetical protein